MSIYVNPTLPYRRLTEVEYCDLVRKFAWARAERYAKQSERGYAKAVWDRLTGFGSLLDDHNSALT